MAALIRISKTLTCTALIVTALAGCDNVRWGGTDIEVVPPPPPAMTFSEVPDSAAAARDGLPTGPVIFHVHRTEDGIRLQPVAETSGNSLRSLQRPPETPAETFQSRFQETVFPVGSEFDVFRRGARVGTFLVQGYGPVDQCGIPSATGNLTVVAAATEEPEFIAFRRGLSPSVQGDFSPPSLTRQIHTYASIVAEQLKLQAGLPNPRSWPGAQRDLQAIQIAAGGHPEMSATYLSGDSVAVGPPNPQGWSIFYIADYEASRGYVPLYSEIRDYRRQTKAVPIVVDYLDWDGAEGQEMLLKVFGSSETWYSVLSQRGDAEWEKIWEGERCG